MDESSVSLSFSTSGGNTDDMKESLKLMEQGIVYDDLSEEDKEAYEEQFANEDGEVPEAIDSAALNEKIFNIDTIRKVLAVLMEQGIKVARRTVAKYREKELRILPANQRKRTF